MVNRVGMVKVKGICWEARLQGGVHGRKVRRQGMDIVHTCI